MPSSPLFLEALGADVVALTFPELIPALQTGLVQGAEAGEMTYASYGLAPVAPHYTLTRHAYSSGIYAANTAWFESLDKDLQSAVLRAIPSADEVRRMVRARNAADLESAIERGVHVYQPSLAELEEWKTASQSVASELVRRIGGQADAFYKTINSGKAAYQKRTVHAE